MVADSDRDQTLPLGLIFETVPDVDRRGHVYEGIIAANHQGQRVI